MKDRNVEYPNRYQLNKVTGTDDIYDLVPAPGEVNEAGTILNKSTLLSDNTAANLGFDVSDDPTIDDVLNNINLTKARIVTGSYVGTGTYGSENPCSLTFDFVPKFVLIFDNSSNGSAFIPWGAEYFQFLEPGSNYNRKNNATFSNTTMTWYTTDNGGTGGVSNQLNRTNGKYYYVAIG